MILSHLSLLMAHGRTLSLLVICLGQSWNKWSKLTNSLLQLWLTFCRSRFRRTALAKNSVMIHIIIHCFAFIWNCKYSESKNKFYSETNCPTSTWRKRIDHASVLGRYKQQIYKILININGFMQSQIISEDQKPPPKGGAEVDVFLHSYTNVVDNSVNVH